MRPRPPHLSPGSRRVRRAFTVLELVFVVMIMGILAAAVIPAMDNLRTMRAGAARDDLIRMIEVAKGRAVASGKPHGLQIDIAGSTVTLMSLDADGDAIADPDPLTGDTRSINLAATYREILLAQFVNGDGVSGSGVIWFDFEANPHTRTLAGAFATLNDEQARVTLSSGEVVVVHPYSGVVEVQ